MPDLTGGGSRDKRPAFAHTFIRDGIIESSEARIKMLKPLWTRCMEFIKDKTGSQLSRKLRRRRRENIFTIAFAQHQRQ